MAAPGMRPHGSLALRGLGKARQARRGESGQSGDSVFLIMMEHRALAFSRAWSKALMLSASRRNPLLSCGRLAHTLANLPPLRAIGACQTRPPAHTRVLPLLHTHLL